MLPHGHAFSLTTPLPVKEYISAEHFYSHSTSGVRKSWYGISWCHNRYTDITTLSDVGSKYHKYRVNKFAILNIFITNYPVSICSAWPELYCVRLCIILYHTM